MERNRQKPQRTCVACRAIKDKRELIRVVRTPTGQIRLDPTGKANGRGAYLCRSNDCLEKGLQKGRLARALKATLSMEEGQALQPEFLKV